MSLKFVFPLSFTFLVGQAFFSGNAYSQVPGSDLPTYDSTGHYSCKGADRVELCVEFFNHITLGADAGGGLVWTHDGQGWTKSSVLSNNDANVLPLRTNNGLECPARFDPYTYPECALKTWITSFGGVKDDGWRFQIGKTYLHPYTALNVTILGILVNTHGQSVYVGESGQGELKQFPIGDNPRVHAFYKVQE